MHLNYYVWIDCHRESPLPFQSDSEPTSWLWSLDDLTKHAISASLWQEGTAHQQQRVARDIPQAWGKHELQNSKGKNNAIHTLGTCDTQYCQKMQKTLI